MSSSELVEYIPPSDTMVVLRDPGEVLAEAQKAASALKRVIDSKAKKVTFNGETYLENEDWQTIARFYNLTASVESCDYVKYGDVEGFECWAIVVDQNGMQRSRASAACMRDEPNWKERPKKEWHYVKKSGGTSLEDPGRDEIIWIENPRKAGRIPKKVMIDGGVEVVPLHQLRSMAQTRACSKALSTVLRFVPVLAGYRPTPAEEMSVQWEHPEQEPVPSAPPPVDPFEEEAGSKPAPPRVPRSEPQAEPVQTQAAAAQTAPAPAVAAPKASGTARPINDTGAQCPRCFAPPGCAHAKPCV